MTIPAERRASVVLLVDDHDDTRDGYAVFLRSLGYSTASASSGEEALRQVWSGVPDLIVLDVHLRGALDGLEVLGRLRAGAGRQLPVILLTGADVRTDELKHAPANRLLQKPVPLDEFGKHIAALLSSVDPAHRPAV